VGSLRGSVGVLEGKIDVQKASRMAGEEAS